MSEFIPMCFSREVDGEQLEFYYLEPWIVHDAIQMLKEDIEDESLVIPETERAYIQKLINKHLTVPGFVLEKERKNMPKWLREKYK